MNIHEFWEKGLHLSEHELVCHLVGASKTERISKGTILIEAGEQQTYLPFLLDGIFRGFVIDAEGRDVTDCIAYRYGDILTGCNALEDPSSITFEAMTDGEVLFIPMKIVRKLLNEHPALYQKYNVYLLEALKRHWEEKILMHRCSAMERYLWFLEHYPDLIDRVGNKHIASFLGMTPVTLSRLRRQLREGETV